MVAKYKERKTNKPLLLFGEGIDIEGGARSQAKTPWEGDVLLNFDALVSLSSVIASRVVSWILENCKDVPTTAHRRGISCAGIHETTLYHPYVLVDASVTVE